MRIWLKIMAVVCLLSAALLACAVLSRAYLFTYFDVRWPDAVLAAAVVFALLTLTCLSFAVARGLGLLASIAAQLPPYQSHECERGDDTAAPRRDEPSNMRDWLHVMGVLCLLPALLFVHHIWSEIAFIGWENLVFWENLAFLVPVPFGLITLSSLSFAGAKGLDLSAMIPAQLPPLQQPDQAATGPTGERAETAPPAGEGFGSIRVWLQRMGVLCLLPAPLIAYDVLSDQYIYEVFFPRWGWADLVFVGTIVFGLVTLSCLSFAAVKNLDLLRRIGAQLPPLHPLPSAQRTTAGLYIMGGLCLLAIPLVAYYVLLGPEAPILGEGPHAMATIFALATLSCLSFAVTKGLDLLQKIAAHVPRLQHFPGVPLTEEGPLSEDVAPTPSPTQSEKQPPVLPPAGPSARPALSSRARRLLFIGVGIIALTAVALVSYHLDPAHAYAHLNRGIALGELGRYEEALTAFDRATQLLPDEAWTHYNRGWTLAALGRHEDALAAFDRAVQLLPEEARAHYNRGWALGKLGRHEEALAAYDQAIQLDPDNADAHCNRGWALGELGRYEEAMAAFDRAIELDPGPALAHSNRGWVLMQLGTHEEALAAFDRAIQLDPDNADAHCDRGWALAELGRHEEALAAYDRAIQLDPASALAHYNKGWALGELGRHEEALAAYDRSIELSPDDAGAHYNRAWAYSLLGRKKEALRNLRRAIDLDGELREPARTDEGFDNLQGDPDFRDLVGLDNATSD